MKLKRLTEPIHWLAAAAAGFALNICAQTNQPAPTLPEVVVLGKPIIEENRVTPLGTEVTTVTQEQIEELNAQDLPSALRRTPGVVISRHNPVGSFGGGDGGAVFIRGMGSARPGAEILTTMDGIPRFVSVWTHPLMDVLSVDVAQRIDVYKGAQPVLFGNMAFGVVDITTKRRMSEGSETGMQLAYGSYNTWVESIEHGAKSGPLDYYFIESFRTSDGHRANADGQLQNYLGRMGYDLSENWNLSLLYHRTDNVASDPGSVITGIAQGQFGTTTDFGVVTLANQFERANGWLKLYWDHGRIDWVEQYNTTTKLNNVDTLTGWDNYGVRLRETFQPWDGGELLGGVDLDAISGKATFVSPGTATPFLQFDRETFSIIAPYASLSHQFDLGEDIWLKPSAGARGFFHNNFEDQAGPQAGLTLNVRDSQLHFGYSHGINYPGVFVETLSKVFMPGNNLQDQLCAEKLDHFEIGLSQRFGEKLRCDVTTFMDNGSDRIVTAPPPPFPPTWQNVGTFDTRGIESTVTYTPVADLALFASGTFLEANPGDLPYTPRWSAGTGLSWRFLKHFLLNVDGAFVDDQTVLSRDRNSAVINATRVSDYFVLSARIACEVKLPWHDGRGQIFLAGENLTDVEYQQKVGYPMPGINCMSGIRLTF